MPEPSELFFSIFFGVLGMAYSMYGKKNDFYFLLCGICLMGYTFVITGTAMVIETGLVLAILPFILTKFL